MLGIWLLFCKFAYWMIYGRWPSVTCNWCEKGVHNHDDLQGKCITKHCDCVTEIVK